MSNCREYLELIVQSMKSYVDKVTSGLDIKIKNVKDKTPSDINYNSSSRLLQLASANGDQLGEGITLPESNLSGIVNNLKLVVGDNNTIKLMFGTIELSSITING